MISFKLILCVALIASMVSAQDYDGGDGDFDGDVGGGPDMGGFGDSEASGFSGSFGGAGGDAESGASFEGGLGAGGAEGGDESRKAAASVPLVYKIIGKSPKA